MAAVSKLSESPLVDIIYVAPGNGGTGLGANSKITNANVKGDDYPGLVAFAQKNGVNLVVPGPEAPLVDGIQGYFQAGKSHISSINPIVRPWIY
jgi:phosphoribosylamine--glycine ligase/phosphoribosylformylglycinamidine cyclo-ligase